MIIKITHGIFYRIKYVLLLLTLRERVPCKGILQPAKLRVRITAKGINRSFRKKKLPVDTDYYMEDVEHLYKKNEKRVPLTPEQLEAMVIPSADEVNEINREEEPEEADHNENKE